MSNLLQIQGYSMKNKGYSTYQRRINGSNFFTDITNMSGVDGETITNMDSIVGVGNTKVDYYSVSRLEATDELITDIYDLIRSNPVRIPFETTSGSYHTFTLRTKITNDGRLGISLKDHETDGLIFKYNDDINKFDTVTKGVIPDEEAIFIMETTQRTSVPGSNLSGPCVPYYFYGSYSRQYSIKVQATTTYIDLTYADTRNTSPITSSNNNGYYIANYENPSVITKLILPDAVTVNKVNELQDNIVEIREQVETAIDDINDISNATREYYVSR